MNYQLRIATLAALIFSGGSMLEADSSVTITVEPFSDTWAAVPFHKAPDFEGSVGEVSGRTITFEEVLDGDFSGSHAITVTSGDYAGVRGRVVASDGNSVTVKAGLSLGGVAPGDTIALSRGWTLAELLADELPNGTLVLLFDRVSKGINVAASTVYEYDAAEDEWYDVVHGTAAGDEVVLYETEAFVIRDRSGESTNFEMTGQSSALPPRVDLSAMDENAPLTQDIGFGVPFAMTLEDSGLGQDGDQLFVFPDEFGGINPAPVVIYQYFEGSWYDLSLSDASGEILEPGKGYVYRSSADIGEDGVSTVTLLTETGQFGDSLGDPASAGSLYLIVVNTDGNGFMPGTYTFPSMGSGIGVSEIFLRDISGLPTGDVIVYRGAMPSDGHIGGAYEIPHAAAGGIADVWNEWAIFWFPETQAGDSPQAGAPYGVYETFDMTIPSAGQTRSYAPFIDDTMKMSEYAALVSAEVTFEKWQEEHFSAEQLADPDISGPFAAPAEDGVANGLKYAFDLDPFIAVSGDELLGTSIDETLGFLLEYVERTDASDLAYHLEYSEDGTTFRRDPADFDEIQRTSVAENLEEVVASPTIEEGYFRVVVELTSADIEFATVAVANEIDDEIEIVAEPDKIVADGESTSMITLSWSEPGEDIFFETTAGTLSSVTGHGDGTYSVELTSSTELGTAEVDAYLWTGSEDGMRRFEAAPAVCNLVFLYENKTSKKTIQNDNRRRPR